MKPYIMERGKLIVQNEELIKDPLKFTQQLLEFKAEMNEMVSSSFKNKQIFQ